MTVSEYSKDFYVYALLDPRNLDQPFYIGKGKGSRFKAHFYSSKKKENPRKWAKIVAIQKAGLSVVIERISENLTEAEAYLIEENLIKKYGRLDLDEGGILTNRSLGQHPMSGRKHSIQSRLKMSNSLKGRSFPDHVKDKLSKAKLGELNPNYNHNLTDEERKFRRAKMEGNLRQQPWYKKEAWNKGVPNPKAADNGRKGASKQSATVTGRKRQYRDDGSWCWVYPQN